VIVYGRLAGLGLPVGVRVEAGRIVEVAPADDLRARHPGARAHRFDALSPGLADAHAHPLYWGRALRSLDLTGLGDPRRVAGQVAQYAGEGWVLGQGLLFSAPPPPGLLAAAARGRPVFLKSRDLHAAWASPEALRRAGLLEGDPWVDAERGWVRERGLAALERVAPALGLEDLRAGLADFAARGYTAVHALAYEPPEALAWAEADADSLPVRLWWAMPREARRGVRPGWRGDRLFVGGVKFFADGALGSRTAWMRTPYPDGSHGVALDPLEAILQEGWAAARAGFQVAVHAIGSQAVGAVIGLLARLPAVPDRPHRIEHLQHLEDADLAVLRRSALVASMQPVHLVGDAVLVRSLFPGRGGEAFRFRSIATGVPLAFGSDAPVAEPDLHASFREATAHRLNPAESVPIELALWAHTRGAAWAAGWPRYGLVAPGAPADLGLWEEGRLVARVFDGRLEEVNG